MSRAKNEDALKRMCSNKQHQAALKNEKGNTVVLAMSMMSSRRLLHSHFMLALQKVVLPGPTIENRIHQRLTMTEKRTCYHQTAREALIRQSEQACDWPQDPSEEVGRYKCCCYGVLLSLEVNLILQVKSTH
mmetsp:Transcript_4507/g.9009  ORF Transcript_4507/g.9009 Transcript_4507/m.9009 type:complete len:132 (-) Transcript_4507:71-466(-)